MKEKNSRSPYRRRMSCGVFLCCMWGFLLSAMPLRAQQEQTFSVDFKNKSLTEVFDWLASNSSYVFTYNSAEVKSYAPRITRSFSRATIETVLTDCLEGSPYTFELLDRHVVIKKRPAAPSVEVKEVRGKVTDEKGQPLPGVTVMIKGTGMGIVSDAEGKYLLRLPKDAQGVKLLFSFVGMKTQEITYAGQSEINITMHEEAMEMDEVVVTGYQVIDKRKNTSSVTTVKMDDIMVPGAASLDQMLEGRVPDMILMTNSGEVGVAPKIRIRGTSTLIGNREPLWVLDGIIIQDPVPISAEELNDPDYVNRIGNAIAGINPQDIERIDVLKDAAATALYGTKAANGVIVVTTKKGHVGKPRISYNMSTTFRQRPRYSDRKINLMNSKERVQFSRELNEQHYALGDNINYVGYEGALKDLYSGKLTEKQFAERVAYLETINTDWFDLLTKDTWSHSHTVSISGGSEQTRYYASVGYTRDNDVIKNNFNQRYTASLNVESTLAKWLTASFNLSGNVSNKEYTQDGIAPLNYAYNTSRAIPAYDEDGEYAYYEKRISSKNNFKYNILNELENSHKQQNTSGITLTSNLQFNFASWLNANAIVSYTNQNAEIEGYYGEKSYYVTNLRGSEFGVAAPSYSTLPFGGELSHDETRNQSYTVRLQLNANKYFGMDDQHNIAFNGGYEMNSSKYIGYKRTDRGYYLDRGKIFISRVDLEKYPSYGTWLAGNSPVLTDDLTNVLSGYATLSYSLHNYFTANVNARIDGSNKFGDQSNDKLLPIWSASANWNLSEHEWMKYEWLDYLSLKTSFGYQGNMLDSESPVMIIKKLPLNTYYNNLAAQVERNPNPNLKWEKTSSYNVGLTLSLLQNRIQIESEFYYKYTKNAFMTKRVADINGVTNYTINGGNVENKGYNVDITISPVKTKDWRWTLSTSFSENFNKVKSKPDAQTYDYDSFLDGTAIVENKAINTFYSYEFVGISPVDGGPMFNDMELQKYELMGLGKYETFTKVLKPSGRREPYMSGGLSTSLRYKQVRMSAMFSYALGAKTRLFRMFNKDLSPEYNVHKDFIKRWKNPGDELNTDIPALISRESSVYWRYNSHWSKSSGGGYGENASIQQFAGSVWDMYDFSDVRVVSANYLKCSSLRFSYEFSDRFLSKMKLSRLELSLSGTNLFTICSKKLNGQTPTQGGFSEIQLSERPTYSFGLTVSF